MTKEEAIVFLRQVQQIMLKSNSWLESTHEPIKEAFDMAIEALEPKTGKWIGGELGHCTCCGHEGCASDMWDRCEKPHCPNCGAEIVF